MGYYERRLKVAQELHTKLTANPQTFNAGQIEILTAQLVAGYGLPKKAAREMVEAEITLGNIKVV